MSNCEGNALIVGGTANVTLDSVVIINDTVLVNGGTLTLKNSTIKDNVAENGVALKIEAGGSVIIEDSTITGNKNGGIHNLGTCEIKGDSVISSNESSIGGGIYNNGTLILSGNTKINKNTASNDGGGIYTTKNFSIGENIEITENTARNNGGGICFYASTLEQTFTGNVKINNNTIG